MPEAVERHFDKLPKIATILSLSSKGRRNFAIHDGPTQTPISISRRQRRFLSGIIFINRNGLYWRDALKEYGPRKALYSLWKRWTEKGIFARMLLELADQGGGTDTLIIGPVRIYGYTLCQADFKH